MLLHGDELGRTQHGNNNTYAQDSEITWVHWDQRRPAAGRVHRGASPGCARDAPDVPPQAVLHRQRRCAPATASGSTTSSGCTSTAGRWRTATGTSGAQGDRHVPQRPRHRRARTPAASTIIDDHFLLYFNADGDDVEVTLPPEEYAAAWDVVIDTGGARRPTSAAARPGRRSTLADAQRASCCASTPSPRPSPTTRWPRRWPPRAGTRAARPERRRPRRATPMRTPTSTYRLQVTRGLRPVRGRAHGCPTCTTSASTGSTCRRCCRPSPAATTATTWSTTTASTPSRGRRRGPGRAVGRGAPARAWACWSTSCPTTSASPRPRQNPWWWDVLKHGRESAHADAFDVDWDAGDGRMRDPGRRRRRRGRRSHGRRRASVRYHDHRFPLAPGTTTLEEQHYELVNWRAADDELNYRRFFAVNTLAGVRVEDPEVFDDVARRDQALVRRGPGRRAARRPPRRPARPRSATSTTSPRSPAAPTCWSRRSSSPARTCRGTGRPPAPPGTTRSALVDRVLTDPAGEAPLDALETRLRGGAGRLARDGPRHQARASPTAILRSEVRRIARELGGGRRSRRGAERSPTRSPSCWPASRSTAPTCPRAASTSTQALAAAREHRPDLGATLDVARAGAGRPVPLRRPCASSRPAAW